MFIELIISVCERFDINFADLNYFWALCVSSQSWTWTGPTAEWFFILVPI